MESASAVPSHVFSTLFGSVLFGSHIQQYSGIIPGRAGSEGTPCGAGIKSGLAACQTSQYPACPSAVTIPLSPFLSDLFWGSTNLPYSPTFFILFYFSLLPEKMMIKST